ncbi:hypothetical protein C8J57DRAFT_1079282, partial [Mycena rebaudengoi]
EAKASLGGSFVITAGLDVNAGAKGTFFGLFDSSTKASLFKKSFTLFSKNFGAAAKRSESARFAPRHTSPARRLTLVPRALACLAKTAEAPVALVDQSVAGKA